MAFNSKTQFEIFGWAEVDLDAAISTKFTWKVNTPILVHGVGFIYTEATPSSIATPGVVSLAVIPSGGTETEKATYTAEVSKAIGFEGKLVNASGTSRLGVVVDVGDTILLKHKVQQTATVAGKGIFVVYYEIIPDGNV